MCHTPRHKAAGAIYWREVPARQRARQVQVVRKLVVQVVVEHLMPSFVRQEAWRHEPL